VAEALEIDRLVGTDLWTRAINKKMAKVKVAWEARDDLTPEEVRAGKARDMIGFQEIGCHIVFDIKMDFMRKARFVAGGHMTDILTFGFERQLVTMDLSITRCCSYM
jgi:hypothetical protein